MAGSYLSGKAHHTATVRRKAAKFQGMKIVKEQELERFLQTHLLQQQSPAAIAGRLATGVDGLPSISRSAIETYLRSVHGRQLEYELKILKQKRKHGRRRPPPVETLGTRTFIDDRPSVITNRQRVGDLEADFIVSGKTGSGYLLTAVDRKIRFGFIRKVLPVTIVNVEQAFLSIQRELPELTSITLDNDILFRFHERLEQVLGVPIYFTHPYSSWQKGSIENFNGQVRKYVKKGADISQYDDAYLQFVTNRLNSRFMSVVGYKTPEECLNEQRKRSAHKKPR